MKNKFSILGIVVLIIIVGSVFYFKSQPTKADQAYSHQLKKDVQDYLVNEQHYSKDDIGKTSISENKLTGKRKYEITVVFKDDKDSEYYYTYETPGKPGKVIQLGATGSKHDESKK